MLWALWRDQLDCGERWQPEVVRDLKHRSPLEWAPWKYDGKGAQWPKRFYKQVLFEHPPGLAGGAQGSKKKKKNKNKQTPAWHQALKDHWKDLPAALQQQAQALGLAPEEPPAPDLPAILQEHLQSLPPEVQQAELGWFAEAAFCQEELPAGQSRCCETTVWLGVSKLTSEHVPPLQGRHLWIAPLEHTQDHGKQHSQKTKLG